MKDKKKVLFVLQSGVGGAERVTVTIGKMLDESKYDIMFYVLDRPIGDSSIEDFIPNRYTVKRIPNVTGLTLINKLFGIIRRESPDFVFSSMMYINTKFLLLSWMFPKTKFIVRNNNYLYTLKKVQKTIMRLTYPFADKIIAQTDEMQKELIEQININPSKIIVLQNPIDTLTIDESILGDSPYHNNSAIKYVAMGRFFEVKGFDILVKAFSKVLEKERNSELYIIGDKDGSCSGYYNQVMSIIEELGVSDHVHCLGFKKNPYIYMKYADCFVLSSRNEGLPNVLIEAQYLGLPAAATTCIPVISRIIKEGENGYLAEPENELSLAEAMLKAVKLGKIEFEYQSASKERFRQVFEC